MTKTSTQILGLMEIAPLLGVDRRTPHMWKYRKALPTPDFASINGSQAWYRSTIIKWADETGRLPETLQSEVVQRKVKKSA